MWLNKYRRTDLINATPLRPFRSPRAGSKRAWRDVRVHGPVAVYYELLWQIFDRTPAAAVFYAIFVYAFFFFFTRRKSEKQNGRILLPRPSYYPVNVKIDATTHASKNGVFDFGSGFSPPPPPLVTTVRFHIFVRCILTSWNKINTRWYEKRLYLSALVYKIKIKIDI